MELKSGYIIVYKMEGYSPFKMLKRWLLGSPWEHISLFFDFTKRGLPLEIESDGKEGIVIKSLLIDRGRCVRVLRYKENPEVVSKLAAKAAERLADNFETWYGFFDIPRYVLPRLIWYKLTGRREGFGYRHNHFFICSELVAQSYSDAGFPLFSDDFIPLPGDFVSSPLLEEVWSGKLII